MAQTVIIEPAMRSPSAAGNGGNKPGCEIHSSLSHTCVSALYEVHESTYGIG